MYETWSCSGCRAGCVAHFKILCTWSALPMTRRAETRCLGCLRAPQIAQNNSALQRGGLLQCGLCDQWTIFRSSTLKVRLWSMRPLDHSDRPLSRFNCTGPVIRVTTTVRRRVSSGTEVHASVYWAVTGQELLPSAWHATRKQVKAMAASQHLTCAASVKNKAREDNQGQGGGSRTPLRGGLPVVEPPCKRASG